MVSHIDTLRQQMLEAEGRMYRAACVLADAALKHERPEDALTDYRLAKDHVRALQREFDRQCEGNWGRARR